MSPRIRAAFDIDELCLAAGADDSALIIIFTVHAVLTRAWTAVASRLEWGIRGELASLGLMPSIDTAGCTRARRRTYEEEVFKEQLTYNGV
jgi:hypothetical protein